MNKKFKYQLLLLVLVTIVVFNLAIIFTSNEDAHDNIYNITTVGHDENGTVYKIVTGNDSSDETVGIILGVHPREHEIHEAINNTINNIEGENGGKNLSKRYVIYYVDVKDSLSSRDDTRPAGENLANKFVVNNIVNDKPFLVIDVHEINPDYEYSNFIFSLSDRNNKINSYISKISSDLHLADFEFGEGTSPEKVTEPIAKRGIPTLLMETSITNSMTQKQETANKLIKCLDELEP